MYGSIARHEIPMLHTYQAALEHYESIKPIRGKDWLRPIINTPNGRRRQHMQIIKHRDETIACRLYDTNVLTYLPDGEIHFTNGGYATSTTHQFAAAILGWGSVHIHGYREQTCINCGKKSVLVERYNPIKLRWNADAHQYDFIDPPKMYAYYLKRALMRMRRKEIEPFAKYVLALAKLVEPKDYKGYVPSRSANWLYQKVTGDNDAQVEAIEFLLHRCCMYRTSLASYYPAGWEISPTILPKDITNILDAMLKYVYFNELFEKREVDKPKSNGNEDYMSGGDTVL